MTEAPPLAWDGMPDTPPDDEPTPATSRAARPVNGRRKPGAPAGPPADLDAERAVLGAALLQPALIPELAGQLRDDDWYHPAHAAIWHTITDLHATGRPVDPHTVGMTIGTDRALAQLGGPLYVADLTDAIPAVSSATYYAQLVAGRAAERRTQQLGTWLTQAAANGTDPATIRNRLEKHIADRNPAERARLQVRDVDTFLDTADDEYDWIIPGLLERHDRLMLTGPEGGGKSTFCRQLATMTAAGMHPFTGELVAEPARVLLLDLENSERQARRKLRPLRIKAGPLLERDHLHVEIRSGGIDLLERDDAAWLEQIVEATNPDILITGPIYRMAGGDPTEEKTAKPVSQALDRVRERGCAVVLETHSPHATSGQRKRPLRPYGASLWLRWPEFGIHLSAEGEIEHWRGPRDEREWPTMLTRGGEWPWTPVSDEIALRWHRIRAAREAADGNMSTRDVVEATGIPRATVARIVGRNGRYQYEWNVLNGGAPE